MSQPENLNEAFLYLYFCVRYYDEHLFQLIVTKTNNFAKSTNKDIKRLVACNLFAGSGQALLN